MFYLAMQESSVIASTQTGYPDRTPVEGFDLLYMDLSCEK